MVTRRDLLVTIVAASTTTAAVAWAQTTPPALLPSSNLHGLKNVGDTPASYYVIKWFPPGSLASSRP